MGLSSILIISLAAGVVLVVGGGLMMYMANLVKSAYEIKVQINNDVDERLTKMAEDLDKKSRWIKRDLIEEIDKIRIALSGENANSFQELCAPLAKKLEELDQLLRNERGEWVKAVESDRQNLTALDTRIKAVRRDMKKIEDKLGLDSSAGGSGNALDEAAAALAAKAGKGTPATAAAGATAAPQPPPAAPPPGAPQPVRNFLPDLA